jgi:uncharacterized protein YgiM (DUF1202 family)
LCCVSCAALQEPPAVPLFYAIPAVTYLRECPNYDCQAVAEIYHTDELTVLEKNSQGWWRVQSRRDQKTGWTQGDLLSKNLIPPQEYYITPHAVPLRDSPGQEVISRKMLASGDKVQKIAEQNGWWRVLVDKDKAIGWIPAKTASATALGQPAKDLNEGKEASKAAEAAPPPPPAVKSSYYFVAAASLDLHIVPFESSRVVKSLKINDKVEEIARSGPDWVKVRYLDSGAEGWAQTRFFKDTPVTARTQIVTPKKRSQKNGAKKTSPDPFKSETYEPEGM